VTHLVDRAQQQYDSACLVVARTQKSVDTAQRTKETLDEFVLECTKSRRERQNAAVSIDSLRIESNFSGKLTQAVESQASSLHELELARDANNSTLASAHRHLDVMQSLQTEMHQIERRAEMLAEQRETDEYAARLTFSSDTTAFGEKESE
jgi:flagellar export protein FliJ